MKSYKIRHCNAYRCPNTPMVERPRDDVSDGVSLYCPQCYTRKSIRKNSFFDKSRLSLQKWVLLLYMWVRQYPVTDTCEEAEVGERTAIGYLSMAAGSLLPGPLEWSTNNTWRPADGGPDRREPLSS